MKMLKMALACCIAALYCSQLLPEPLPGGTALGDGPSLVAQAVPTEKSSFGPPPAMGSSFTVLRTDPLNGFLSQYSTLQHLPNVPIPAATGIHEKDPCGNGHGLLWDDEISPEGNGFEKQSDCGLRTMTSEVDVAGWDLQSAKGTWFCDNNGKIVSTYSFDSHLTGSDMTWSCTTGKLVGEEHFTNGLSDGQFRGYWFHGQFDMGKPVGQWTFSGAGGAWTELVPPSGTVYWAVPDVVDGPKCNGVFVEVGELVDGVKEGKWYAQTCKPGGVTFPIVEGQYIHGIPDGQWRWYSPKDGSLVGILTFVHGALRGPFMYFNDRHLMVTGELSAPACTAPPIGWESPDVSASCNATRVLADALGHFSPPLSGWTPGSPPQMTGVWRYYTNTGFLLGQSSLAGGNGHLVQFSDDGGIEAEGDVVAGHPDGVWKIYESRDHRLCVKDTMLAGVLKSAEHVGCSAVPPLKRQ